MSNINTNQVSILAILNSVKDFIFYCLKKWKFILIFVIIASGLGALNNWLKKPKYEAVLTFALEESGGDMGGYANLASQLGFSIGGGGGGDIFKGDNLLELMKSRKILEKTLLSEVDINGKKKLLVNFYLEITKDGENYVSKGLLPKQYFVEDRNTFTPNQDSILYVCQKNISANILSINRVDKKLNIISVSVMSSNAYFGSEFCKVLVKNLTDFYVETVTKKQSQNVKILEKQADSLKGLMTGSIIQMAQSNDLNINPLKQIQRTTSQRKQIDVQVYLAAYGEILKNLELARINLLRETPLIQIIDLPRLPLENKKKGRLNGAIIGFVLSSIFLFLILIIWYKIDLEKKGNIA